MPSKWNFINCSKSISSFLINNNTATINNTETIIYGNRTNKNASNDMFDVVYTTILCGAPTGRTIHPTFAAIVCRQTVIIIKSARRTFFSAMIENVTNRIKETSFVMKIELKKVINTNTKTSIRVFAVLVNSLLTSSSNTARFFKTSTIILITNNSMMVSQLI